MDYPSLAFSLSVFKLEEDFVAVGSSGMKCFVFAKAILAAVGEDRIAPAGLGHLLFLEYW
jgi:hypothetical protein